MNRRRFLVASVSSLGVLGFGLAAFAQNDRLRSPSTRADESPATPYRDPEIYQGDVRDLWVKPWALGDKWARFRGVVEQIRVAPPGEGFEIGADPVIGVFRSQMLVAVDLPNDESETILVVINSEVSGIYADDSVEIVGKAAGRHDEPAGGGIWPFYVVIANSIELVDVGTPESSE